LFIGELTSRKGEWIMIKNSDKSTIFKRSISTDSTIAHELYEWLLDDELVMDIKKQKVIFRIARRYDELFQLTMRRNG
jgi:hypothetical protein